MTFFFGGPREESLLCATHSKAWSQRYEASRPQHMVRHVRAVGPAVPYWDLVPVTTPTPTPTPSLCCFTAENRSFPPSPLEIPARVGSLLSRCCSVKQNIVSLFYCFGDPTSICSSFIASLVEISTTNYCSSFCPNIPANVMRPSISILLSFIPWKNSDCQRLLASPNPYNALWSRFPEYSRASASIPIPIDVPLCQTSEFSVSSTSSLRSPSWAATECIRTPRLQHILLHTF